MTIPMGYLRSGRAVDLEHGMVRGADCVGEMSAGEVLAGASGAHVRYVEAATGHGHSQQPESRDKTSHCCRDQRVSETTKGLLQTINIRTMDLL